MAYSIIKVESYFSSRSGIHGPVHIRPLLGQDPYTTDMHVECSKDLSYDYPVGTVFEIKAKITNIEGGQPFGYSHYSWPYKVIKLGTGPKMKQ